MEHVRQKGLAEWRVPGVAIAIVWGDSTVVAGYGVRRVDEPGRTDARTVFAAGSVTKAFTATLVGMLADSGLVRWNDPVSEHLPGFRLADPHASRELSLRDALAHRGGLPPTDMLWLGRAWPRDQVVRRQRFVPPACGLRTGFRYHNVLYVAVGEVVHPRTGRSWDEVVRVRLLEPLGDVSPEKRRQGRSRDRVASESASH